MSGHGRFSIFSILFGLVYTAAFFFNVAIFKYYPLVHQFHIADLLVWLDRGGFAGQRADHLAGAAAVGRPAVANLGGPHSSGACAGRPDL
jgi:hypothetical protein